MVISTDLVQQDEIKVRQDNIRDVVMTAARSIAPLWPLTSAIACNPLLGFESIQFWDAVEKADSLLGGSTSLDTEINVHMIKWCAAFFDEGAAPWAMPGKRQGLYKAVLALLAYDKTIVKTSYQKRLITALPSEVDEMLYHAFQGHGIASIERRLASLPGWAGYVVWHSQWKKDCEYPCDICEFLALRAAIEMLLVNQVKELGFETKAPLSSDEKRQIEEREACYDKALLEHLLSSKKGEKEVSPLGQLVFCIDCRSEPLRRQIEKIGPWKTYGFAGFFGLPIQIASEGSLSASCPVILDPKHTLAIQNKKSFFDQALTFLKDMYKGLKYQFGASFALAEASGPLYGLAMLWRLGMPSFHAKRPLLRCVDKTKKIKSSSINHDLSIQQQIEYGYGALMMMGMSSFSPLVVFCGHSSTTANNPHKATLQCGACAARAGGMNALLLATILNSKQVRAALKAKGLSIPDTTYFLAAEHDTTLDTITFYNAPESNLSVFNQLIGDLSLAAKKLELLRGERLNTKQGATARALDWSEVRPEWGLAKNASFVIGDIANGKEIDLEARSFLHSYDYTLDPSGEYLQTILSGPLAVAHWINMQYFFSTLRPHLYGSGSKITLNVVGKMGVMQGNASDLMTGLPYQSLFSHDEVMYHMPQRLVAVIHAPQDHACSVIAKIPALLDLIKNEWIRVVVIDPKANNVVRVEKDLNLPTSA